ncbi:MAG: hypothetical protein H6620_07455 [Halobacteriovoraceae bacterium]|nr:hypothetical protein [Halobacteriovoraceae bacterium]
MMMFQFKFILVVFVTFSWVNSYSQTQSLDAVEYFKVGFSGEIQLVDGGRNGGDGLEIEIELMAKKIVSFVDSDLGKEVFPEINIDYMKRVMRVVDVSVTDDIIIDQYGFTRTCTNDSKTMNIECNLNRWGLVTQPEVYYALVLHELLGLMNVELGNKQDVSKYPISSRILNYIENVENAESKIASITPEYFALKNTSYGIRLMNGDTGEEIRLICVDDVSVVYCDQFSIVRKLGDIQVPLLKGLPPLNRSMLERISKQLYLLLKKKTITSSKKMQNDVLLVEKVFNYQSNISYMNKVETLKDNRFNQAIKLVLLRVEEVKSSCFSNGKASDWCNI